MMGESDHYHKWWKWVQARSDWIGGDDYLTYNVYHLMTPEGSVARFGREEALDELLTALYGEDEE